MSIKLTITRSKSIIGEALIKRCLGRLLQPSKTILAETENSYFLFIFIFFQLLKCQCITSLRLTDGLVKLFLPLIWKFSLPFHIYTQYITTQSYGKNYGSYSITIITTNI